LGYWNIRGLAQAIRYVLEYSGIPWEDKRFNYGPAPEYSRHEWLDHKKTLTMSLPNLPYFINPNDGTSISQSKAIMHHLARKFKLDPKNEKDKIRVEIMEYEIEDLRNTFVEACYSDSFEKNKEELTKKCEKFLERISGFLEDNTNSKWTVEKLTYVDFFMFEMFDVLKIFNADLFAKLTRINEFMAEFEKLEKIAEYRKSDRFSARPINGAMASWK